MNNKIFKFIKENIFFIMIVIAIIFLYNYKLPYYIDTPGGTISINDRIECSSCSDINGSLNMLYVSEYVATIPTYLLSYLIPNWDLEKISEQQINHETTEDIYTRSRLMLESSKDNATLVAYQEAGKSIEIVSKKNLVLATTLDNNLKIGDEILAVNNKELEDISELKDLIQQSNKNEDLNFNIKRNGEEKDIKVKVQEEDQTKLIGAVIITDYEYKTTPKITLKFKTSESGSSGGLMMALSMYTKISDIDVVKGRKIAGTGTIEPDGTVGEIDGIKYKLIGAVKNNIDIVLVPEKNYEEAIKVKKDNNYDIEIVKVKTFKDAIDYLKS